MAARGRAGGVGARAALSVSAAGLRPLFREVTWGAACPRLRAPPAPAAALLPNLPPSKAEGEGKEAGPPGAAERAYWPERRGPGSHWPRGEPPWPRPGGYLWALAAGASGAAGLPRPTE